MANAFVPSWRRHDDGRLKALQRATGKLIARDPMHASYGAVIGCLFFGLNVLTNAFAPGLSQGGRLAMAACVSWIMASAFRAMTSRFDLSIGFLREFKVVMLRHGYCPACSFNLHGLNATGDHVRCPECGGAWAARRIVDTAPTSPFPHPSIVAERPSWAARVLAVVITDHRGRRERAAPWARVRGARPDYATAFTNAVKQYRRPRSRAWMAAVLGFGAAGLAVFSAGVYMNNHSRYWDEAMPFVILTMVACFVAAVLVWHLRMPVREYRARLVNAFTSWSLCPRCGSDLVAELPAADGCVQCMHCDAAWRLGKPPAPCHQCGYDLTGVPTQPSGHALCPECVAVTVVDRDRRGLPPRP